MGTSSVGERHGRSPRDGVQIAAEYDKLFIGGKWVEPSTGDVIEVHSPATGLYVGKVPLAAKVDVDAAVAAARVAFDHGPWPATSPAERAAVIGAAVKLMEERKDGFTKLLADETGAPPSVVEGLQWMGALESLSYFAGAVQDVTWREIRSGLLRSDHRVQGTDRGGRCDRGVERAAIACGEQTRTCVAGRLHGGAQAGCPDAAGGERAGAGLCRRWPARRGVVGGAWRGRHWSGL